MRNLLLNRGSSPQMYARIGGVLYLIIIVAGLYGEVVRGRLLVAADPTATAHNIMASGLLFRSSIAGDLFMHVCDVPLTLILYVLLRPVSKDLSLLGGIFSLLQTAILCADKLNLVMVLLLLGGSDYLKGFEPHQLQGFGALFLVLHEYGFGIGLIFFGVSCLVLGYLIFRSGYFPKSLGILQAIAGLCYLINSFAQLLAPSLAEKIFPGILLPAFLGELSTCLWLLVKGIDTQKWNERLRMDQVSRLRRLDKVTMDISMRSPFGTAFFRCLFLTASALGLCLVAVPIALIAQSVPLALESPPAGPAASGPHGEKLPGMPKFRDPAPYDIEEHTGYKQIFDGKSFAGWDADPSIWRVEAGVMVGETLEGKPKGNNYIVYRGEKTRDFDLKLQMKIEKGGGGGIQYRSVTGIPWTRPQPVGQPPYDLKFMMTGPQADFWFPVSAQSAAYTGQWYSENTMQGILAYRGQVTQALPGQTNRLIANIGDKQALGGYVKINEWNDYEIVARSGVMMHIMNGQLMAVFIDDNNDSVNNQPGLIGFEIESQPCKISVRDIWLRKFD